MISLWSKIGQHLFVQVMTFCRQTADLYLGQCRLTPKKKKLGMVLTQIIIFFARPENYHVVYIYMYITDICDISVALAHCWNPSATMKYGYTVGTDILIEKMMQIDTHSNHPMHDYSAMTPCVSIKLMVILATRANTIPGLSWQINWRRASRDSGMITRSLQWCIWHSSVNSTLQWANFGR